MVSISRKEPFVILLDLDHTIQGNIQPQLDEYNFIKYFNDKIQPKKYIKQDKDAVKRDFMKGLLRPNFRTFISKMKSRFPNVEFFVYTASDDLWAKYVVKIIEEVIGIRFNKRIFSRSDCVLDDKSNNYMKSIDKLRLELKKILKTKYKLQPNYHLNHVYLIDNNFVLYRNESEKLIKCPSYLGTVVIDKLRSFPVSFIQDNLREMSLYFIGYHEKSLNTFYQKLFKQSKPDFLPKDSFWISQLKTFKRNYKLT
mgnify:FL=1